MKNNTPVTTLFLTLLLIIFNSVIIANVVFAAPLPPKKQTIPLENKIHTVALPSDAPCVTVKGIALLPDGSPADNSMLRFQSAAYFFSPSENVGNESVAHKEYRMIKKMGMTTVDRAGTFQINDSIKPSGAIVQGENVVVTACLPHKFDFNKFDGKTARLVAPPLVFVAQENAQPLAITFQEGIPVRGKVLYENGTPAAYRSLNIEQQIMPVIGSDIPEMRGQLRSVRPFATDQEGEYKLYLLPGKYTVNHLGQPIEALTVVQKDTLVSCDFILRTPIVVKTENADSSPARCLACETLPSKDQREMPMPVISRSSNGESFFLDSITHDTQIFLHDMKRENGIIETVTPAMIGKTLHFRLKPMVPLTLILVDHKGNPAENKPVILFARSEKHQSGEQSSYLADSTTDSEGKAVLRVPCGKISAEILFPGRVESSSEKYGNTIQRELDLPDGGMYEWGTVKLF